MYFAKGANIVRSEKDLNMQQTKGGDMEATVKTLRDYQILNVAAGFNTENAAPTLFQWLGYRKHAAQRIIKEAEGTEAHQQAIDAFNYAQGQIALIIGI
jgi:hypothetical protein